jgi:hypothetical protein
MFALDTFGFAPYRSSWAVTRAWQENKLKFTDSQILFAAQDAVYRAKTIASHR